METPPPPNPAPGAIAPILILLLLGVAVLAPWWLLPLVRTSGETFHLGVTESVPGYSWIPADVPDTVRAHYQGAHISNGRFLAPDGRTITAFAAWWKTGEGPDLVYGPHTPDVCYPAAGASPVPGQKGNLAISVGGKNVPFGRRAFQQPDGPKVLVYFANLLGGSTMLQVGDKIWTRFVLSLKVRSDQRREQCYLLVTTPVGSELHRADEALDRFLQGWLQVSD